MKMRYLLLIMFLLSCLGMAGVPEDIRKDIAQEQQLLTEQHQRQLQEKRTLLESAQKAKELARKAGLETARLQVQAQVTDEELEKVRLKLEQLQNIQKQLELTNADFQKILPQWPQDGIPTHGLIETKDVDALLEALHQDALERSGASRAPGKALAPDECLVEGEYLRFGPVLFFQSADTKDSGQAAMRPGSMLPSVAERLTIGEKQQLRKLFQDSPAMVPVDVTLGQGLGRRAEEESLSEHFRKGGPVMIPIAVLALFCLLLAIYKVCAMARLASRADIPLALELAQSGDEKAIARLPRPLAGLVQAARAGRGLDKDALEEKLYEYTLGALPALERYLSVLAVGASAAPLLGLLGTVTGMIHTFKLITIFGTGDARLLSGGISEALITTEAGLLVAIPALLVHAWCVRRAKRTSAACQEAALLLVEALGREEPRA